MYKKYIDYEFIKLPGSQVVDNSKNEEAMKLFMLGSIIKREGFMRKLNQNRIFDNLKKMWNKYPRTALFTLYEMLKDKESYQDIDIKGLLNNDIESNPSLIEFDKDKINSLYQKLNSDNNMYKGYVIPEIKLDLIEVGK